MCKLEKRKTARERKYAVVIIENKNEQKIQYCFVLRIELLHTSDYGYK